MRILLGRASFLAIIVVVGCGSDDPKTGNGVDDVAEACAVRAQWNRANNDCSLCEAAVITPRCDCSSLRDFSAACIDQQDARASACAATVDTCINACDRTSCPCILACYATGDACKKASDARDGCIAAACASYCK